MMFRFLQIPWQRCCAELCFVTMSLVALVTPSYSAEPPREMATVEGITEYQYANGLKLLLFPDPSRSQVTVNMTVLVGSRHEGYGETGMAHLLEHMVFKGTPTHPNVPKVLQDHGAEFNGTTSTDRTNYFETLPATDENLEFALRLESDRLVNSFIKKSDLESEFSVVRNEFERGENSPMGVLSKRIAAAAYEWHNYGKSTIGNRSDIERVPIENLQAFYRKFYQPDNVVVVVAGQFREARAIELVTKYFGSLPRPERKLDQTYTEEPPQDGERTVTLRRVGDVGAVGLAYHIPAGSHEDIPALQVLTNILDAPPSGRLYVELVSTKKAANVSAFASDEHDPGLLGVDATVRDPALTEQVRDTIISIVEGIGKDGVTEVELNRSKQQILKARELSASSTSRVAISLSEWVAQGDWRLYFIIRDRIEKVTAADVQRVARKYLLRDNRTVGIFIPTEKPQRATIPATPNVAELVANYKGREAIAAGEAFEPTLENIESRVKRFELPEGIRVVLLPKKTRGEEVNLSLTLRYGNEENLRGYEVADDFLGPLMLRGTKQMTYQQIRDELDRLTARMSSGMGGGGRGRRGGGGGGGGLGALTISIQAKRDTLPETLKLLQQVLREPTLPAEEFEIMKRERLARAEQTRSEPSELASTSLRRQLSPFPKGDVRYVPTIDESIDGLQSVTYDQVVRLYREFLGAQAGELTIVGDFDPDACIPIVKETLSNWKPSQAYARITAAVPKKLEGGQQRINTPDKANATYVSGTVFPMSNKDPDFAALTIANFIFGGGSLASRLGDRVRQQEGLSYGVGSSFVASAFDLRAAFSMNAISNPQNIGRVELVIREELEKLVRDGITKDELERAKQGYLQSGKVARANDGAIAGLLAGASYEGRTLEFQMAVDKKVAELTVDEVNAAIRKHIHPDQMIVISAGDFGTGK